MDKFEIKLDMKKLEKEINMQIQQIAKAHDEEENFSAQREVTGVVSLDKMAEEALKIIVTQYDGNSSHSVDGKSDMFPDYMRLSTKKVLETLENARLIAYGKMYLGGVWSVVLTPDGISYFEQQEMKERRANVVINWLPGNAKKLLTEILDSEDPVIMLQERFEKASPKDDSILRGILSDLISNKLISILWADDVPEELEITNSGRTYLEREKTQEESQRRLSAPYISIGTINASDSNFIFGDVVNSTISIDKSIEKIEMKIEKDGGEEKEELKSILDEIRNIIIEINSTGAIPQNTGWLEKVGNHLHKHEWFYGAVVSILGKAVLQKIQ